MTYEAMLLLPRAYSDGANIEASILAYSGIRSRFAQINHIGGTAVFARRNKCLAEQDVEIPTDGQLADAPKDASKLY